MNKQVALNLIFWLKGEEENLKNNVVVSIYLKNIQQSGLFPQVSRGENVQRYLKTHHPNQDSHHPKSVSVLPIPLAPGNPCLTPPCQQRATLSASRQTLPGVVERLVNLPLPSHIA